MKWDKLPEPFDKDFRYFLVVVWKHLQLPDPTPVQLDIADYMQVGPKRRIIEAFGYLAPANSGRNCRFL